jgi:TatD DNase family protein
MSAETPRASGVRGWFDSHCHLQGVYLSGDDAASAMGARSSLSRAFEEGVERLVCVGTDPLTSTEALELARATHDWGPEVPRAWATVGVHPHEAERGTGELRLVLAEELARQEQPGAERVLVGIGECGLDYHYDHASRAAQRATFAEQIALAHQHDLTLVVHAREAWDDLFAVLGTEGVPKHTILHCFTGGPRELERSLDIGLFASFSGIVTFKNARDVQAAAQACPADRLLVETDSPFLAPSPHRGRPNEPRFVVDVGAGIAQLRDVSVAEIADSSATAAARAFGLSLE